MASFVTVEMLPADYGDALHLSYGDEQDQYHIWIDGGLVKSFRKGWRKRVRQLGKEGAEIDLLVVTHIDTDHINGIVKFLDKNQRGANPPAIIPVRDVWFNQYRHIRACAEQDDDVRERPGGPLPQWHTKADFVAEIAELSPQLAKLAARVAAAASPEDGASGEAVRGVPGGRDLVNLLDGGYASNAHFGDEAVVRRDAPPVVDLPGGAKAWVLAPDEEGLVELYHDWEAYLKKHHLAPILRVRGVGPMSRGDALVPGFVEQLMLRRKSVFDPQCKGREEDLALPIATLAERDFEEDESVANSSSIAFLFEFAGRKILLAGDAYPSVMAEGLRKMGYSPAHPLTLDAFKVAHHGSRANTSDELLQLLRCDNYMISTNSMRFDHPDKECLARIIWANRDRANTAFYFNYDTTPAGVAIDVEADRRRYGYSIEQMPAGEGLRFCATA